VLTTELEIADAELILVGVKFATPGKSTHMDHVGTPEARGVERRGALQGKEHVLTTSNPPDSAGHRQHLRSAKLGDLQDGDLYSALLFAASDSMDAALSREARVAASARKAAAMGEIERREAPPPSRRTPPGGIRKTRSAPASR
jgi:hypothetical protein